MVIARKAKRLLFLTHRYLGIAGCLLLCAWFLSGVVMMYVPFPRLGEPERLEGLADLALDGCCAPLAAAFEAAGIDEPAAARLTMVSGRPVYHLTGASGAAVSLGASDLAPIAPVERHDALAEAAAFTERATGELSHRGLVDHDQWTVYRRYHAHRPLHHLRVDDGRGTEVYVSSQTGEVVLVTTRTERAWSWGGAVLHWLYFRPLRQHGAVWAQVVIWLSVAACLVAISGFWVGLLRLRLRRRYSGDRVTPYRGLMRWHHVAGLVFGLVTLTWAFSGLLSMNPWGLFQRSPSIEDAREAIRGGPADPGLLALSAPAAAGAAARELAGVRELRWVQLAGAGYWQAVDGTGETTLVHAATGLVTDALDRAALSALAAGMRSERPAAMTWLEAYDSYYYARRDPRPLPVLRVEYDDPDRTWYYLDPAGGGVVGAVTRSGRVYRWLYNGLHSFDLPFLLRNRPLWDILLIVLSLGGFVLCATGAVAARRRLSRRLDRRRRRGEPSPPIPFGKL